MLKILERFQQRVGNHCKPVIVADAAMLSTENMASLSAQEQPFSLKQYTKFGADLHRKVNRGIENPHIRSNNDFNSRAVSRN